MEEKKINDARPTEIGEWVVKSEAEMTDMILAGIQKVTSKVADGTSIEKLPGGLYRYRLALPKPRALRSDAGRPRSKSKEGAGGSRAS